MATTPSVTIESHLSVKSPTVDVCSSNMMPLQRISTSSPTTMKSSPMSADINQLSALSSGQAQLLFNRLVSVDLSQQQNSNNLLVEDQRTLQLALELSIVGLSDAAAVKEPLNSNNNCNEFNIHEQHYQQIAISRVQKEKMSDKFDINTMKGIKTPIPAIANNVNSEGNNIGFKPSDKSSRSSSATFNQLSVSNPMLITALEDRSKKSQNMTECVPVPSSEHVAEIVGRQALPTSRRNDRGARLRKIEKSNRPVTENQ